jgi:cytochrome b
VVDGREWRDGLAQADGHDPCRPAYLPDRLGADRSATARFGSWRIGPAAILGYIRNLRSGVHKPSFGHNPMGTLSVIAILAALFMQVGTGLFAVDVDGLESGPLATLVSFEAGRQAAEIHEISFNILLALIGLHVAAIVAYLFFFKDNLVRPMVTRPPGQ